jgi:BirA family transcriptional regulator, biotin operon repressor / biotin---[acetyl-CoA-carboxylase] ligase
VPLLTGLAIADGLRAIADVEVGLKWPNDVLTTDERKLAGILTEATSGRSGLTVVTGFGVNLRWTDGPPAGVPAVDLATLVVDPPERFDLLTAILVELEGRLRQIEDGDRAGILDSYRTRCISIGRRVRLATPSGDVIGDVVAVDDNGHLVIAKLDGGEVAVSAGDAHHLPPPA